jgi:hypothetical protein
MTPKDRREIAEWCEPMPTVAPGDEETTSYNHWRADYCSVVNAYDSGVWVPRYKYDSLNSCAEFERVLVDRSLEEEYADAVISVLVDEMGVEPHSDEDFGVCSWALITCGPAQRVEAILRVIREAKA